MTGSMSDSLTDSDEEQFDYELVSHEGLSVVVAVWNRGKFLLSVTVCIYKKLLSMTKSNLENEHNQPVEVEIVDTTHGDSLKVNVKLKKSEITRADSKRRKWLRNAPKPFFKGLEVLSLAQRVKVSEIGFGSLLDFRCYGVPAKIGHFVVDSFKHSLMKLELPNGEMMITPQLIHDIFGLPCGGISFKDLSLKDNNEQCFLTWNSQFGDSIRPSNIVRVIEETHDADFTFVLNFLILFLNTIIGCETSGKCKIDILQRIDENVDIKSIDWCGYIFECLKTCKVNWKKNDVQSYFTGPITVLLLIYLEASSFKRLESPVHVSAMSFWTLENVKKRESLEIESGGFGLSDVVNLSEKRPLKDNSELELLKIINDFEVKFLSFKEAKIDIDFILFNGLDKFPNSEALKEKRKIFQDFLNGSNFSEDLIVVTHNGNERMNDTDSLHDVNGVDEELHDGLNESFVDAAENFTNEDLNLVGHEFKQAGNVVENFALDDQVVDSAENSKGNTTLVNAAENIKDKVQKVNSEKQVVDAEGSSKDSATCVNSGESFTGVSLFNEVPKDFVNKIIEDVVGNVFCEDKAKQVDNSVNDIIDAEKDDLINLPTQDIYGFDFSVMTSQYSKRVIKPGEFLKSPYRQRITNTILNLEIEEIKVSNSFFSMVHSPLDSVFITDTGKVYSRAILETLIPGCYVHSNVIDIWSIILNDEEKYRPDSTLFRYYFEENLLGGNILGKGVRFQKRFSMFEKNLQHLMNNDKSLMSFKKIHLVFVPMNILGHYYVIILNLKEPSFLILDNKSSTSLSKYNGMPQIVLKLFSRHFQNVQHQNWKQISILKPVIPELRWSNDKTETDSAIYAMCHMESYVGGNFKKYNPGLYVQCHGKVNKAQLDKLRCKFLTKILLSDINISKELIVEHAEEFDKYNFYEKKKMLERAKESWPARLKEFLERNDVKSVAEKKTKDATFTVPVMELKVDDLVLEKVDVGVMMLI
ncbi:hypothetical protein QVD17_30909 [Tagetes erecta]|uniref:Ubiquitin-like protease family profile domain-containing protein n=1 Tax=Tagetes erecta TaxID=13708 RepID=A0AAD8K6H4_TARER|nr:hypothetical protein QVD17_30909 [Tagetes erecta]